MSTHSPIPFGPKLLGPLGLAPFFASAAAVGFAPEPWAGWGDLSLIGYGAVILSFLGGVRWGRYLTVDPAPGLAAWTASIAPSLLGWVAVLAHDAPRVACALLIAGFTAQYLWDRRTAKAGGLPAWYGRLRTLLSLGAITALAIGWILAA
ncbi:MAG: DUF3429 domain-containing protein [Maricaulaceae bacterium]